MCVPRIKNVNVSRRALQEELVRLITRGASFSVSSNTADSYNLHVAAYEVEFDRENNQTCVTYTIDDTIGDTTGAAE